MFTHSYTIHTILIKTFGAMLKKIRFKCFSKHKFGFSIISELFVTLVGYYRHGSIYRSRPREIRDEILRIFCALNVNKNC